MAKLALTLVIKDYDYLGPLTAGDVVAEDLDLTLDRDTPRALDRTLADASILAGEISFARHIARLAENDHTFVGIPFMPTRGFRHRALYTLKGSGTDSIQDLVGKRVGTNEWPATGKHLEPGDDPRGRRRIEHQVDGRVHRGGVGGRPQGRPAAVRHRCHGRTVADQPCCSNGELDALMSQTPKEFYDPGQPDRAGLPRLPQGRAGVLQANLDSTGPPHRRRPQGASGS